FVAGVAIDQVISLPLLSASVAFNVNEKACGAPSSDIVTSFGEASANCGALMTGVTSMVHDCTSGTAPFSSPSATSNSTASCQADAPPSPGDQLITPVGEMLISAGAVSSEKERTVPLLASSGSSTVITYSYSCPSVAVVGAVEVICGASLSASILMVHFCVTGAAPSSPPSATCTSTSALLLPAVQLIRPVGEIVMSAGAFRKLNWRSVPLLASSGSLMTSWYWYGAPSVAEVEGVDVTVGASFTGVTLIEKNC